MQLILTQATTEDIKIKMSAQTETPVNGNIVEIKEVTQGFKIDGETIAAIEKSLSSELSASEISKDIVFIEEENVGNITNINGSENCIQENNVKENDLLESANSVVSEIITNGTSCAQDAKEAENKTQYLEIININEDGLATNKTVDSELCLANDSSNVESFTKVKEKAELANSVETLSKNTIITIEESKDESASDNTNALVNKLESDKVDFNNSLMDVNNASQNIENVSQHTDMVNNDTKYAKLTDVEMCEEIHKVSEKPIDNETTNESNAVHDGDFLDNEDVVMHEVSASPIEVQSTEDPIKMDEDILPPNQTGDNIIALETNEANQVEADKEESLSDQAGENIILLNTKDVEHFETDKKESLSVQNDKALISPQSISSKPIDDNEICLSFKSDRNIMSSNLENRQPILKDEKVLSSIQTDENITLKSDAANSNHELMEEILPSDQQKLNRDQSTANAENDNTHESTMLESVTTSGIVTNAKISKGDSSEIRTSNIEEIDLSLVNSTETSEESKVIDDKKNIDNESMEVDDNGINNVERDNLKEFSKHKDTIPTSNEEFSEFVMLDSIKQKANSNIVAEEISEDITVGKQIENSELKENKTELNESSEIVLDKDVIQNALSTENVNSIVAVENERNDSLAKELKDLPKDDQENIEIIDEDDVKIVDVDEDTTKIQEKEKSPEQDETKALPVVCKLSNTLDILSDDEDEASNVPVHVSQTASAEKQCIELDDDDDIMLIEEDLNSKDKQEVLSDKVDTELKQTTDDNVDVETGEKHTTNVAELAPKINEKDSLEVIPSMEVEPTPETDNTLETENKTPEKPLLPQNFLKTAKKNLANMTRHELEDFCILRIVESIVDRSNLSDIKTKMKTMAQNLEDYKKRVLMMTKQNRDLQVVLKSVQEEQKKRLNVPIQPLKITRSVGMQVLMNDKLDPRRKAPIPNPVQTNTTPCLTGRTVRGMTQNVKPIKPPVAPVNIPVPRKVPVSNSPSKPITNAPTTNVGNKSASPNPNGLRNPSPVLKVPEKRPHSRIQSTSVTVDLTDDEPPAKVNKNSPAPPVRVVPQQNLLAQQRQFPPINNNARKVYIPISGPTAQQMRPGQTYVMKNMVNPGPRPAQRIPIPRPQQPSPIRPKQTPNRHPAPLPESMKQYTPSTWKALPPAPDLKLSKVENGIVISWKIDGYPEGGYETIASYQLYAYQETAAPPCTALWKKIGDVKALPLPMACTLTQFMAGFKYYFAVRAVDVRSRLGPFSLPGSILLLNKV